MRCLIESKITTDVDSLRSEIRDKSVRVIDVRREDDYKQGSYSNCCKSTTCNFTCLMIARNVF